MNEKVYSTKTHSISRTEYCENTFSLTINFFELSFEVDTYKLIDVVGFFPLIKAIKTKISIPQYNKGDYCIRLNNQNIKSGEIYNYNDIAYTEGVDFKNSRIYYDTSNKIICIGEIDYKHMVIKVNDYIVCVLDQKGILRCLYIMFDRIE